jgi:hypothetical protein
MELFKVRVEFKTVIRAENAESAEKQAESIIKESDDPADFVNATPIKTLEDLPYGWDAGCLAWGPRDELDRTIGQIIAAKATDEPEGDKL